MITKSLQESLALEQQLTESYEKLDAAKDSHERQFWANETRRIRTRLYKLPNYNRTGLEFIQAVLARANPQIKEQVNG